MATSTAKSSAPARPTAADVARRAGVSRATVSYVLNDVPNQTISLATREAVHEAATALGYRPHPLAQSLKRGHSTTVLLPLPGFGMTHVVAQAIDGCATALARAGFTLVTDFSRYDDPSDQVEAWLRLHPAAVIDIALAAGDPAVEGLRAAGIALLSTRQSPITGQSAGDAMAIAVRVAQVSYVLGKGRRHLLLTGPGAPDPAVERRARQAIRREVRRFGGTLVVRHVPITAADSRAMAAAWASMSPRPDAICAFSDEFAIALLSALAAAGVDVPGDVAVIGVDDIPLGAAVTPTLTTVGADFHRFGEQLADATTALINGAPLPDVELPAPRIVERESA